MSNSKPTDDAGGNRRSEIRNPQAEEESPPFLGTWKRVYWSVVIYTVILTFLLYLMTVTLNR
ncbi:MAG: hypothetical protein HY646_01990 [Acidobacteria bacterium]|nr:hypothetical protein [Acidobacteriota bacterium]